MKEHFQALERTCESQGKEIARLNKLIIDHNLECDRLCDDKKSCGYEKYQRDCGNCTKDWIIDTKPPVI